MVCLIGMTACTAKGPDDTHQTLYNPLPTAGPVETIADGFIFTEGPLWTDDDELLFSDIPANRIYRWTGVETQVFREPSGVSNGLILDASGRLLAAEHQNRRISRTETDGTIVTVVDAFEGTTLNSPNDLVLSQQGHLYFSDPPYGINESQQELSHNGVYMLGADGALSLIWIGNPETRPNGVALSPDQRTLYVSFTREGVVRAFALGDDGLPVSNTVFVTTAGSPDGLTVDASGNLYVAAKEGVEVYGPTGEAWGTLVSAQQPTNCTIGGNTLFITARQSLYSVLLERP